MISGLIASGMSTLANEIVRQLRSRGLSVALTDLDTVAAMALPTLPDWDWAHHIHAQLVGAWLATNIDVVIDEDTSSREEVHRARWHRDSTTGRGRGCADVGASRLARRATRFGEVNR